MEKSAKDRRLTRVPLPSPYSKTTLNAREGVKLTLGGVSSFGTPPLIYIGGSHGAFGRGLQLYPLEPTLGAIEELPRVKDEAVGPMG